MIRLVVNADDLGLDARIDQGIFLAHRDGIVTSASLLATGPTARDAVRAAGEQGLPLGLHLCLTTSLASALPAREVPSLAPEGRFRRSWTEVVSSWLMGQLKTDEVDREFRAQIALARQFGAELDHLDGHQHLHLLPGISFVVRRIALDERLPLRWPAEAPALTWLASPGRALKSLTLTLLARAGRQAGVRQLRAIGLFEAGALDERRLLRVLQSLGDGDHEIGCHPGKDVGSVSADPNWKYGWDEELRALCSLRVREEIRARAIVLCSYRELTA